MTSYVTPKKNAAFVFYVSLEDKANAGLFKASPTLAAGDVLVATDDGAPANITTLPAVDADFTKRLKVSLSAAEMNGDNVTVIFSDAAGAEWYDLEVNIQTSARQVDDLAYPATSGRSLTVAATGEASVNVTYSAGVLLAGRLAEVADLPAAAPSAAVVADAVWDEAISGHLTDGTTGARLNTAASASGTGSTAYSNTVTDDSSNPLDGVEVWITSDSGGASTVASTTTDTLGAFTVYLDPGTYYLWLAKGGYNFGNPTTITVS